MDLLSAMNVSASGLSAERTHLNVISMNLANINTTETPGGGAYKRKSVYYRSAPIEPPFEQPFKTALEKEIKGVKVAGVVTDQRPYKRVYDPGHPDADQEGYVNYPDINVMEEMTNLLTATRSYEANVSSIKAIKKMYSKALTIGR
jgi:flagellar basal-body rod protein FlgC